MQGFSNQHDPGLADLTGAQGSQYNGWSNIADAVAIEGDLDNSGDPAEYLFGFTGEKVHVLKATGDSTAYTSWTMLATSGYHNGWGAGWSFNGSIHFANNNGLGVYELPLNGMNLGGGAPVEVKRVASAGKIETGESNNGMNCLASVNPWLTPCFTEGYREVPATKYGTCPQGAKTLAEIVPTTTSAPMQAPSE